MLPWLSILCASLDTEYADRPRIGTLATVDPTGQPRARTVILRQIDPDGALWIVSSAHSDKNAQLRQTPAAELVLYLPTSREQFRLFGQATVIGRRADDQSREQFWTTLSDAARATFFWPTIGRPANNDAPVPAAMPASAAIPDHFELLRLNPTQVEHLATATLPHLRTRWRAETNWQAEPINP